MQFDCIGLVCQLVQAYHNRESQPGFVPHGIDFPSHFVYLVIVILNAVTQDYE